MEEFAISVEKESGGVYSLEVEEFEDKIIARKVRSKKWVEYVDIVIIVKILVNHLKGLYMQLSIRSLELDIVRRIDFLYVHAQIQKFRSLGTDGNS